MTTESCHPERNDSEAKDPVELPRNPSTRPFASAQGDTAVSIPIMATKIQQFNKLQLKNDLPDIRPGDTVQVYQRILPVQVVGEKRKSNKKQEEVKEKEKIQVFEGLVLAKKHGKGINATITVRKVSHGFGVEKIFPIHSPLVQKIDVTKRVKVRRAKLYYLREAKGKRARLKAIDLPKPK